MRRVKFLTTKKSISLGSQQIKLMDLLRMSITMVMMMKKETTRLSWEIILATDMKSKNF